MSVTGSILLPVRQQSPSYVAFGVIGEIAEQDVLFIRRDFIKI